MNHVSAPALITERFATVGRDEAVVERVRVAFELRVARHTEVTRRPRLVPVPLTPGLYVIAKVLDSWHVGEYTTSERVVDAKSDTNPDTQRQPRAGPEPRAESREPRAVLCYPPCAT
jgi:hypothetical protein